MAARAYKQGEYFRRCVLGRSVQPNFEESEDSNGNVSEEDVENYRSVSENHQESESTEAQLPRELSWVICYVKNLVKWQKKSACPTRI